MSAEGFRVSSNNIPELLRAVSHEVTRMRSKVTYYNGPQVDRLLDSYEEERRIAEASLAVLSDIHARLKQAKAETTDTLLNQTETSVVRSVLLRARKGERRRASIYSGPAGSSFTNTPEMVAGNARSTADQWDELLMQIPNVPQVDQQIVDLRSRKTQHRKKP